MNGTVDQLLLQQQQQTHSQSLCTPALGGVVVEHLVFKVPSSLVDLFIEEDAKVWTSFLSTCPGFLHKQVWTTTAASDRSDGHEAIKDDDNEDIVVPIYAVIWWASYEQWQAIPQQQLAEVQREFVNKMRGMEFPIETRSIYQIKRAFFSPLHPFEQTTTTTNEMK